MCSAKDQHTLIEQSSTVTSELLACNIVKRIMRMIGNDQKNGQNFWEILERIIGKILSIVGAGLINIVFTQIVLYFLYIM